MCPGESAKLSGASVNTSVLMSPVFDNRAVGSSWLGGRRRSPLQMLHDLDQVGGQTSLLPLPSTCSHGNPRVHADLLSWGCSCIQALSGKEYGL